MRFFTAHFHQWEKNGFWYHRCNNVQQILYKKAYLTCFFNLLTFIFKPHSAASVKKSRTLCTEFNVSESVGREMSGIKRAPCVTDYAGGWHWCGPVIHVIMCNNIPKHLQIHTHDTNKIYNTYRQQILFEIYDNRRNINTHNLEVIKNCLLLHRRGVYYL